MNTDQFDETTQIPSETAPVSDSEACFEDEATVIEEPQPEPKNESVAQTAKKFGTIAGGGVILGSLSALLAGFAPSREHIAQADEPSSSAEGNDQTDTSATLPELTIDSDAFAEVELPEIVVTAPSVVNDDMTFEEAFDNARTEVGPGGAFAWHGDLYSTYTPQEWTDLAEDHRVELVDQLHLSGTIEADLAQDAPAQTPESEPQPEASDVEPAAAQPAVAASFVAPEPVRPADDDDIEILSAVPERPESGIIEILGVTDTVVAEGQDGGEGQEVLVIDVDGDMLYDYMALDTDGNGVIDPDEIIDIHQQGLSQEQIAGLSQEHIAGMTASVDSSLLSTDGPDYMADSINEG